ncbi:tetratricopeptide repeat protein [Stieleria sp. TO1_6]|uniref:tetratricopeptide repeat protein n=1 Tax=Stieleria tagensis TaxID=2956795 RepID=UPI00209AED01|nr:tetratricopeptide repeat protein [Stieleria tagensis]MCO8125273.1 tetratricopeptide repeat protein [Stieleria tagensis]
MNGPKNVGSSIAGGAKNAAVKSRDKVAGWFGKGNDSGSGAPVGDATDPVSLAHKAEVTPEVFVANGRLWESTGNFEKAMESYAKALESSPNDPAALSNIARLHFRQNNHEKAAEYFGKAIKVNPEDAGLYNDLGLTLSKLGNHGAAATTIEQALRLSPGSSRYANNLASVKFESGDPNGALEVLVNNNKPAVAHFNMAYLHYKHRQNSEATRHLNQSLACQTDGETDPATKRAIERSRELLAQMGAGPAIQPGTAIAAAAPKKAENSAVTLPNSVDSTAPQQASVAADTTVATKVQQAASGFEPGTAVPGFQNVIQPASAGKTSVSFGNASFKTPTAPTAPATMDDAPELPTGQDDADAKAAEKAAEQFSLPPSFQLPQ